MAVTHATVELLAAMRGVAPPIANPAGGTPDAWKINACGAEWTGHSCWACLERIGMDDRLTTRAHAVEHEVVVTCPACIALYPDEIRVRMDFVSERDAVPL